MPIDFTTYREEAVDQAAAADMGNPDTGQQVDVVADKGIHNYLKCV